jgi:nucleoside-diphosphate-sugar epimerase
MAINYGRKFFERVVIFRPHNVFGPEMGWEHVIPQFVVRMKSLTDQDDSPTIQFPIQGTGMETRSFIYIDDFTDGLLKVIENGQHLEIYHIGTTDELSIAEAARRVGHYFGREVEVVPGAAASGGTPRRCPDISKLAALGFQPTHSFDEGLSLTAPWYIQYAHLSPHTI